MGWLPAEWHIAEGVKFDRVGQAAASELPIIGFAEAMLDLVQAVHAPQDRHATRQLLLQATADLMSGQDACISFVRKACSHLTPMEC